MAGPLLLPGALNHWGRYLPWYHLHTVCFWRGHSLCRAPLTTGVDIYPRGLPSAYCVLLAGPLPLQAPLTTGVDIYPRSYHLHAVCFWRGHSLRRAPLTTGVDIYPRVLPSAYCVLLAGPLPLQGALNHWGRYLPQGPTICILCASGGANPIAGRP